MWRKGSLTGTEIKNLLNSVYFKRICLNRKDVYDTNPAMNNLNSLPIKTIRGVVFIKHNDIIFLKAERKNTLVFIDGDKKPICARGSLSSLKAKLPHDFFQCHRSFIINLKHIALFEHKCKIIKMSNEEEVRLSEKYQKDFMKLID